MFKRLLVILISDQEIVSIDRDFKDNYLNSV